jgi:hypothetical protein
MLEAPYMKIFKGQAEVCLPADCVIKTGCSAGHSRPIANNPFLSFIFNGLFSC